MGFLAVIDRGYRGAAEAHYFDALHGVLVLGPQLGGLDVVLRGSAVCAAIDAKPHVPVLRVGGLVVDTIPDQRATLRALLAADIVVWVDGPGVAALGLGPESLVPGVRCTDTSQLAEMWDNYEGVWFL